MTMIHHMIDGSQELDTLSIVIHSDQWEENSVNIWKQRKFPEKSQQKCKQIDLCFLERFDFNIEIFLDAGLSNDFFTHVLFDNR